ncbi:MAG: hypothetical protein K6U74_10395 [Firmicutes bacterium]|nr:hypothetical protein [Bacillota bacterium]
MTDLLRKVLEKFNGRPAEFTPEQLEYIGRMFDKKGPVMVRMGVKKETRFYSSDEWEVERDKFFPGVNKKRGVK